MQFFQAPQDLLNTQSLIIIVLKLTSNLESLKIMKKKIITVEIMENCKSRNSKLSSTGFYKIKLIEIEFEDNAIGTDKINWVPAAASSKYSGCNVGVVKKRQNQNKAG